MVVKQGVETAVSFNRGLFLSLGNSPSDASNPIKLCLPQETRSSEISYSKNNVRYSVAFSWQYPFKLADV